jgi:hypothetical protein
VNDLYPGSDNVNIWYREERTKHKDWPSNPNRTYRTRGWIGFPELVGEDNMFKKEFLSFEDFQKEVSDLYPGTGAVLVWYVPERIKHKDWPSNPGKFYSTKGWIGWPELVGRENRLKIEYLSFDDFRTEVISKYPGKIGIKSWYRKEKSNHPNWTSRPERLYENKGWISWTELVGEK